MVQLTDREKDILNANISYLKDNDVKGFCNSVKSYGEVCGRLIQFIMDSGVPIFDYLEQIPDFMFNGADFRKLSVPDHITKIGKCAFKNCKKLNSIEIGDSVSVIGDEAFSGCTGLIKVFLPNSVRILGNEVFKGCDNTIIYAEKRSPGNRLKCKQAEIPWYKEHLFRQPEQENADDMNSEEQL